MSICMRIFHPLRQPPLCADTHTTIGSNDLRLISSLPPCAHLKSLELSWPRTSTDSAPPSAPPAALSERRGGGITRSSTSAVRRRNLLRSAGCMLGGRLRGVEPGQELINSELTIRKRRWQRVVIGQTFIRPITIMIFSLPRSAFSSPTGIACQSSANMSSEGRLQDFELACELSGHDNEVRAVCSAPDGSLLSGGQDRLVRRWVNTGAGDAAPYAFVEAAVVPDHEHWVVCLLPLPAGAIAECPEGGFVTGSLDKTARIFALDGSCVRTLTGHTGGVISLAWTAAGDLLTGSWDGTARRWRVATGECVETLPGHENGVCVMELDGTDVLTGSTGRQQDDTVVGFQIRRWRAGREMQHITDHSAAVRCLIPVPGVGFASASNDGTVRVRDASGTVLQVLRSPDEPFILTACVLPTGELLSGGVDSVVRVWRDGAAAQEVQLPGTVWWLASLANGDFAVACADRTVRVFTRSPARMAPEEARAALREAVQRKATGAQQSVDVASLPDYADSERVRGSQEGQVHLFRRGDKAFAFRWSQAAGSWLEIGEVTGTAGGDSSGGGEAVDASTVGLAAGKQELGGQLYDMVVPVEMESTDGPAHLQLGFNVTGACISPGTAVSSKLICPAQKTPTRWQSGSCSSTGCPWRTWSRSRALWRSKLIPQPAVRRWRRPPVPLRRRVVQAREQAGGVPETPSQT